MAGAGYKLFTTGSVLTAADVNTYLAEQTVMVFANAAARTTALSGVVSEGMISYLKDTNAVEVYDGSNWVSSDDPNAIQNSIINAKGDLIVGSANDTPSILSVSSDGSTLVADSSTSTGLRWQQQNIRNYAYNSNFDIWQRGTSFANTSGYFADRWTNSGVKDAVTVTRQTSGAPAGSYYYMRHTATGANAYWTNHQYLETQDVEELLGKTVTFSVKIRRNATTNNVGILLFVDKSATVDAGSGATWTAIASSSIPLASIPTGTGSGDWVTGSVTLTVPNDGTANSLRLNIGYNGVTASGSVYDFAQVMLQVGSVVTTYQRQNATLAGELVACKRYYEKSYELGTAPASATAAGAILGSCNAAAATTGSLGMGYWFTVEKRVGPTITIYDTVGNSGKCSRTSLGFSPSTNQAVATFNVATTGFGIESGSSASAQAIHFHYVASAEL